MESSPKIGMDFVFSLVFLLFFFSSIPSVSVLSRVYIRADDEPITRHGQPWNVDQWLLDFVVSIIALESNIVYTDLQVNKGSPRGYCFFCLFLESRCNSFLFPQIVDECHLRFAVTTKKKKCFLWHPSKNKRVGANTIRQAPTHNFLYVKCNNKRKVADGRDRSLTFHRVISSVLSFIRFIRIYRRDPASNWRLKSLVLVVLDKTINRPTVIWTSYLFFFFIFLFISCFSPIQNCTETNSTIYKNFLLDKMCH